MFPYEFLTGINIEAGKIRMDGYAKSGYVLGRNFIATFESSSIPLNSNTVDININEYLL